MIQNNPIRNDVFWGLKENWWKQIYDGRFHQFGNEVFDKGLHDGPVEPGFYNSAQNASEYASEQMGQLLTIECYRRIHQLACQHFSQVSRNVINVDKTKIDDFRNTHCQCFKNITKQSYAYEDSNQFERRKLNFILLNNVRWSLYLNDNIQMKIGCKKELDELPTEIRERLRERIINECNNNKYFVRQGIDGKEFFEKGISPLEEAIKSMEKVTEQLQSIQKKLNLSKPFASLKIDAPAGDPLIYINYNYQDPAEIEKIISILIDDYNRKIKALPSDLSERNVKENEFALKYIAELFQNLEWLHPFFDGQGRTDLILLAKLLTENGFNPSILYEPYFSTFEPLERWITYLKEGIENWEKA